MKKNKLQIFIRTALTICAAWGWWGFLYPELTMTADTYKIVYEDGEGQVLAEDVSAGNIYEVILNAHQSQLRFRSSLFLNINAIQEQGRGIHESGEFE